jgi:hypothetical protein
MKFLVIEQDLRVSGTSQGIISRSFLAKLRIAYPKSIIDVVYLKQYESDDQLDLLPVDSIKEYVLDLRIPFFTKWLNKFYWRLFHVSLKERYIHKVYGSHIGKVDYQKYDHIFIRSTGLDYDAILGSLDLPILKKAVINFHEPYPTFWCAGATSSISNLELFRMKQMQKVVEQAKACMGTHYLARDMQFLYGTRKQFYVLPHQYVENIFDLKDKSHVIEKSKKVTITYHGALQFGRNIDVLLDTYSELIENNNIYKENTEFVLRLKSSEVYRLRKKYEAVENIKLLESTNFSNSAYEQKYLSDINILLENGPIYCSVLLGKAPFLATIEKPIFSLSPSSSEMRNIVRDERFIANYNNKKEIQLKLENLIVGSLNSEIYSNPFGDYFSDKKFKNFVDDIIK